MSGKLGKREIFLSVLALGVIALSVMLKPDVQQTVDADPTHALLATGLKEKLNDIDALEVTQGDDNTATIAKDVDGIWRVKELYGYPASTAEIRKALLYLSQSEIRTEKTADAQKMERIGLGGKQAVHVTLKQGNNVRYQLQLGNQTKDMLGTYVKIGENPKSYVASGQLALKTNPHDWLFYDLFSISRDRVRRIHYDFNGKKDYEFMREKVDGDMHILPKLDDATMKERPLPMNPSYYFERMQFTDVLPESKVSESTQDITTVQTFDGLVIKVSFHMIDFKDFVQFSADVDTSLRDETVKNLIPLATVQQEANAINERTKGWLYELGQFNYNQLRTSYFDLVTH